MSVTLTEVTKALKIVIEEDSDHTFKVFRMVNLTGGASEVHNIVLVPDEGGQKFLITVTHYE